MKQGLTFGFEMTGIIHGYKQKKNGDITKDCLNKTYKRGRLINKKIGIYTHPDIHCIEFPSPVFTSFSQSLKWYKKIRREIFPRFRLTPKNPITVCGGNHLNFGGLDITQRNKILCDLAERPYIPWIFTQPDDTASCDNFTVEAIRENNENMWTSSGVIEAIKYNVEVRTKSLAVATGHMWRFSTLEYRCVEAPYNEQEFKDQFDFFYRYTFHALESIHKPLTPITRKELNKIAPNQCIYNFYLLLDRLGLDHKRYNKYIRRNLLPRWTLGRKRV